MNVLLPAVLASGLEQVQDFVPSVLRQQFGGLFEADGVRQGISGGPTNRSMGARILVLGLLKTYFMK